METKNILSEDILKAFSEQFHSPRRSFENTMHSIARMRTTPFPMDRIPFTDNKYKVILSELLKKTNKIAIENAKEEMDATDAFYEHYKKCFLNSNERRIPERINVFSNIFLMADEKLDNTTVVIKTTY